MPFLIALGLVTAAVAILSNAMKGQNAIGGKSAELPYEDELDELNRIEQSILKKVQQ